MNKYKAQTVNINPYQNEQLIVCDYLSKEEVEEKTKKLNNKIDKLNSKLKKQEEKYEQKIKELEAQKWKYKVGDVVLYDKWRKVKITALLDQQEYKYAGEFLDSKAMVSSVVFKPEELSEFNHCTYEEELLDKIWELKRNLEYRNGK